MDFGSGTGPFSPIKGLYREVDDQLIGSSVALSCSKFNPVPVMGIDPYVSVQPLRHGLRLLLFCEGLWSWAKRSYQYLYCASEIIGRGDGNRQALFEMRKR